MVISEALSEKYFPGQMAVGKALTVADASGKSREYTVAAVTKQIPDNSSIQFSIITNFDNKPGTPQAALNDWRSSDVATVFLQLKEKQAAGFVTANLNRYVAVHNSNRTDWPVAGFALQPFSEVATSSDIDMPGYVHGSQLAVNPRGVLVIVPAIMSIFLLLITCFNFTNISIAFAGGRLKEIGIRKVMGGVRRQLIRQFLTENIVLCLLASIMGLLFVLLLLPAVSQLAAIDLSPNYGKDYGFWLFLLLIPIVCAALSGLYPAVYISSFQPVKILKGKVALVASNRFTRFLLISQFSLSCFALVVGIVMSQNAAFQQRAEFGYDINDVAVVAVNGPQQYAVFSQAIQQRPDIKSIAGSAQQIGDGTYPLTVKTETAQTTAQVAAVGGQEYLNSMGIQLDRGRHFYATGADADASILVNETFVQRMQLKEPLGQQVTMDSARYTIVGVVKDYKEFGLHGLVPPCVLRLAKPESYQYMIVRANKGKLRDVAGYLQQTWRQMVPDVPYRGYLQADLIEKELRMTTAFKSIAFFLAIVTLLLSASGLFAQISLNIDKRSKEIGVRKVLGASVLQIIGLVNREFVRVLLIAFVAGSVLGYLFTNKFIFQVIYKYHTEPGVVPYIGTFLIMLLCCGAIVGTKVFRAATTNPIERLRAE